MSDNQAIQRALEWERIAGSPARTQFNWARRMLLAMQDFTGGILPPDFSDAEFSIFNDADNTKVLEFDISGVTTATTRTLTMPDADGTIGFIHINRSNLDTIDQDLATTDDVTFNSITAHRPIVSVLGTTKTVGLSDSNTFQDCENVATQTITIPLNATTAFPIGTEIEFFQKGAGVVTFLAAGGVTLLSKNGDLTINSQYGAVVAKKLDTDEWALIGDLQ